MARPCEDPAHFGSADGPRFHFDNVVSNLPKIAAVSLADISMPANRQHNLGRHD